MTTVRDINSMFADASARGVVSAESYRTLTAPDLGARIKNALGVSADDVSASEVFLVATLMDDSSSIVEANKVQAERDGHNLVVDRLKRKARDIALAHAAALNRGILYPFMSILNVPVLDDANFHAGGGTPLYDQTIAILATVLAKEREFAQQGVPARTSTLIVTDGEDYGSLRSIDQVRQVIHDMRAREVHIVAAMGVDNGRVDFRKIFQDMGIDPNWILTPSSDPADIDRCFELYSQSTVQASQGAAAFSKTMAGGFGRN